MICLLSICLVKERKREKEEEEFSFLFFSTLDSLINDGCQYWTKEYVDFIRRYRWSCRCFSVVSHVEMVRSFSKNCYRFARKTTFFFVFNVRSFVLDDRQIHFQYDRFNWNRFTSGRQWRFDLLAFAIQSCSFFVFHFESFRIVSFRKRSTMNKKNRQIFPKR